MTKLIYLTDSYKKTLSTKLVSLTKKGDHWEGVLEETIFYPEGGGQPSDKGEITGKSGKLVIHHVRMKDQTVIHEGTLTGTLKPGETVSLKLDWDLRFGNMRVHSAGHIIHEIVMQTIPGLTPLRGEHGKHAYIEYQGTINPKLGEMLEKKANMLIAEDRLLHIEFVTLDELKKRAPWVPKKLPKNKPLRILEIAGFPPIPDGGTQVKSTSEIGEMKVTQIEQLGDSVRVHYMVPAIVKSDTKRSKILKPPPISGSLTLNNFQTLILELQSDLLDAVSHTALELLEPLKVRYFGTHGQATLVIKKLRELPRDERKTAGMLINEFKESIDTVFKKREENLTKATIAEWFDVSLPGIRPPEGHLHIVTQAIIEITRIFERISFTRVRHPEVDWDWYPFESLNMPPHHPARDEWETFFIESSKFKVQSSKFSNIVLTPHTSNGQVREMEKGKLPIRMINIAKCYRRQSDVSHVPMFHQFEGLYVDHHVSIAHLKGVLDYFVKQFFGIERQARIRPFHFQFTEPSFEVDISCGVCLGKGKLPNGTSCKLCKSGWLELGGAGMVHPVVLRNGGVDPDKYSGFAFGWGVERTYMMKSGTELDDIRLLYSNDLRFLEQF